MYAEVLSHVSQVVSAGGAVSATDRSVPSLSHRAIRAPESVPYGHRLPSEENVTVRMLGGQDHNRTEYEPCSYRHDGHQSFEAHEVAGIARVQVEPVGVCRRCDHEIGDTSSMLSSRGTDGGHHLPVAACCGGVERKRFDLRFHLLDTSLALGRLCWI